jgi:hypothetical protein
MAKKRHGRIMNVGINTACVPVPYRPVCRASNAYIKAYSQALAEELDGTNVTVTALFDGSGRCGLLRSGPFKTSKWQSVVSADTVARAGYAAMMQGQRIAMVGRSRAMGRVFETISGCIGL